ncbi:OmcA/MtrC family decaheme c-type cytochrome [Thalassotalea sp. G2M2-11]|uniref:OmcA/MtrC family decaheme c-type cytochrome n=1 Tax=Thalassotalea sp. G2M2-11 TaxID=2787627 RepID=UPI0019CF92B8|nr:OmcA/MtrC family decaheme c-type cytochrome [Thalassotalea sp. G2M2-11]
MNTHTYSFSQFSKHFIFSLLILLTLSCGQDGQDGAQGPMGEPGPPGPTTPPINTEPATSLTVTITGVEINSAPVVHFSISDQNDQAFTSLTAPRFSLAKLIPGANGDSDAWQSYINRTEDADGNGPGTETKIQATQDRNGTLVNHNDGSYTYTFANNITEITTPLPVNYQPELTHRLAIQISGNDQPTTNSIYTWRPSDQATTGILTHDIVKTESCNSCHDGLAMHGGGRINTQLCVTCHNPGSTDANSNNSLDFKVMIHKIHRGKFLPSVLAGNEYAIWGYRDSKHDYSEVSLPMNIRHCSKCHDSEDPVTVDAIKWQTTPTIAACGSCHDDVDFALGKDGGHPGGVMDDNSECTVCHRAGGFVGSIADSHKIDTLVASKNFKFNILSVTRTRANDMPQVTFSITNPQNNNESYDILNDNEFTAANRASRIAIDLAWNTNEYSNEGSGSPVSNAVSLNPLANAFDNGDGSFTVTSNVAIPDNQMGSGAVAVEGHPAVDLDGDGVYSDRVPVKSEVAYFSITDDEAVARRQIVAIEKCQACHVNLSMHGANRNDNTELCVMCHNPSATDISKRNPPSADGLKERSIDFKRLIHSIHASEMRTSPFIVYGFGGSEHNFSHVTYPGKLNNCETCHINNSYQLPLAVTVQGSTIDTGASLTDREDDLKITPTAAVCSSCHDDYLSKAHMEQNGGASFATSQSAIDNHDVVETCTFCHGPDGIKPVKTAHGIE